MRTGPSKPHNCSAPSEIGGRNRWEISKSQLPPWSTSVVCRFADWVEWKICCAASGAANPAATIAQAATVDEQPELAVRAIVLSASRGWRDPVAQEITAEAALAEGDYAIAADRIAALWSSGEDNERLDELSGRLLASEAGMQAMADRYREKGRWQGAFRRGLPGFTDKPQRELFFELAGVRK